MIRCPLARCLLFALAVCLPAGLVRGHSVWIEPLPEGRGLLLKFAEPDGRVEKSPGRLDGIAVLSAFQVTADGAKKLPAEKKHDHFLLVGSAADQPACADTAHDVMVPDGQAGRLPVFHSRWAPSLTVPATPAMTLDLVPTGKAGEVRVHFRGKPLGGVKVTLRTPTADREIEAGADGLVTFEVREKGLHLLTLGRHSEPLEGFFGGQSHAVLSHNASLAWIER